MTVQISSLRVSADLDATKYVAGAQQLASASGQASAANAALGASVTSVQTKISAAGDPVERLSRQFVDGYAATQRMSSAFNLLGRAIDTGKVSMQQADKILDGILGKFRQVGDASQFVVRGQNDMAAAIGRANTRFIEQQGRQPANGNRPRLTGGQIQGLGYQINDVATMALLGASPGQIAFSQGGQILQNLQMNEGGISGSLAAIKNGAVDATKSAVSLLGTTGLLVSGFGLATAAVGGFLLATRNSVRSADDILKDHEKNIRALVDAYGSASDAAVAYGKASSNEGRPGIAVPTAMTNLELQLSLRQEARTSEQSLIANDNGLIGGSQMGPTISSQFKDFAAEIDAYRSSIARGTPDVLGFRKAVTEKWDLDQNNDELTREASTLLKLTDAAKNVALALPGAKAALDALNNGRYPGLADVLARQNYEDANNASLTWLQRQQAAAIAGIGARSPAELRQVAMANEAARPGSDNESEDVRQFRIASAGALAYQQALHSLNEAQDQRKRSLDQTLASVQLDIALTGKTTPEAAGFVERHARKIRKVIA